MNLDTYKTEINDDNWNRILENKILSQIYLYFLLLQQNRSTCEQLSNSTMTNIALNYANSIINKKELDFYKLSKTEQKAIWDSLFEVLEKNFKDFKKLEPEDQINILENLICIHFSSHIQRQTSLNISKYGFEFIKNYEMGIKKYNENLIKTHDELLIKDNENLNNNLINLDIKTIEYLLRTHLKEMKIDANIINRSIRRFSLYHNHKNIVSENFILSLSESFVRELTTKNIKDTPFQKRLLQEIKEKKIKNLRELKTKISEYLENQVPIFNFNRFQALNKTINKYESLLKISHQDYEISLSNLYNNNKKFIVENLSGVNFIPVEEELLLEANKLLKKLDEIIDEIIKIQKFPKTKASDERKLEKILKEQEKNSKE